MTPGRRDLGPRLAVGAGFVVLTVVAATWLAIDHSPPAWGRRWSSRGGGRPPCACTTSGWRWRGSARLASRIPFVVEIGAVRIGDGAFRISGVR